MTVSVRFSESELSRLREYALLYDTSLSDVIRESTMKVVDDALDIQLIESAMDRITKGEMKTISLEKAGEELGFK